MFSGMMFQQGQNVPVFPRKTVTGASLTPIVTFIMAIAVSSLSSFATPARAEPQMQLVCEGGIGSFFCRSLAAALEAEFGPVAVSRTVSDGMTSVQFVTETRGRDVLTGHLAWHRADGTTGAGPTLTLSASDAELNDAMLDRFAIDLLRYSKLPL